MAFPRIVQQGLLDWIERNLTADQPAPTDAEIMEHFGFRSVESARSLLADLADAGRITIKWGDGERVVALGRVKSTAFKPVRVEAASVVRRDPTGARTAVHPDTVLAHPMAIHKAQARHTPAPVTSSPAGRLEAVPASEGEQPAAEQARVEPAPPITSPSRPEITGDEPGTTDPTARLRVAPTRKGRADTAERVPDRQVGESPAVDMKRLPTAPGRKPKVVRPNAVATKEARRQLNVHFAPAAYADLEQRAAAAGLSVAAYVRDTLAVLTAPTTPEPEAAFAAGKKPFIAAPVIRAARAAGQPLDIFVTAMILRGFAAYQAEQPAVRAA